MEKLTEKLAEFCENIKFEKLPKDVVERTKLLILDTVGTVSYTHLTLPTTPYV